MSSSLLSILVILLASSTHRDFVYAQKTGQEEKSQGSQKLVAVPQRIHSAHCSAIEAFEGLVGPPSFQRQFLPSAHSVSNGCRLERAVEVCQLWQNERQESCVLRQMWRHVGQWNASRYTAEIQHSSGWLDVQSLERLAIQRISELGRLLSFIQKFVKETTRSTEANQPSKEETRTAKSSSPSTQGSRQGKKGCWTRWAATFAALATTTSSTPMAYTGFGGIVGDQHQHCTSNRSEHFGSHSSVTSRQSRVCPPPTGCLSGCAVAPTRSGRSHRPCRARHEEECHEVTACGYVSPRQSPEIAHRNCRSAQDSPQQLVGSSHGKHQDLGIAARNLPQTWCGSPRGCSESKSRYCSCSGRYSATQYPRTRGQLSISSGHHCGRRRRSGRRPNRCRRGETQSTTSRSSPILCRFFGRGNRSSSRYKPSFQTRRETWNVATTNVHVLSNRVQEYPPREGWQCRVSSICV